MGKILIYRYHPVCEDLCLTFSKMGFNVTLVIDNTIKDHYGDWSNLLFEIKQKYSEFNVVNLSQALCFLNQSKYNLVGLDENFQKSDLIIDVCNNKNIPYFAIDGYPNVYNKKSKNILSLGWMLPTIQYNQKYPSEIHKKEEDWKNIFEKGISDTKNICVFYPNFWNLKNKIVNSANFRDGFISVIQRYEECNRWNFEVFNLVKKKFKIENLQGLSNDFVVEKLLNSKALVLLKWSDRPGIGLFEAMLLGRPVVTMKSFVLASGNFDVLIDGYNAIVADSVDELLERMSSENFYKLGENAYNHSIMLTDFDRQKRKLNTFLKRCIL